MFMDAEHSNLPGHPEGDDLLDRAIGALRDGPVASGPSPQLIADTQAALRRSSTHIRGRHAFQFRPAFLRVAAAIVIISGAAIAYRLAIQHQAGVRDDAKRDRVSKTDVPNPAPVVSQDAQPKPTPAVVIIAPPVQIQPLPTQIVLADGVISGHIFFDGIAPPPKVLSGVNLMPDCQKHHLGPIYDESLVVNRTGGIANVVVSVSEGLSGWLREEFPPPLDAAVLDQKGCVFSPHVVTVMVGQPLFIRNSDPFLHNVRVMAVNNPIANLGQPSIGEAHTVPFESPEVFRVKCDVHPWMEAWVRVVDNPFFAVTDAQGCFTLRGLPPGTYTLKAWHEQLGIREQQVTLVAGHGSALDFSFRPLLGELTRGD